VAFEEGADGVRLAMEAANKKTEDAVREKNEHLAELSSFRRRAETAERAIDAAYAETASACKKARVAEASRDASTSEANDRAEDAKNQVRPWAFPKSRLPVCPYDTDSFLLQHSCAP